jgi:hypothetical protein
LRRNDAGQEIQSMKCRSCGADNTPDATTCSYCGSRFPLTAEPEKQALFARIRSSAEYAGRDSPGRHARLPKVGAMQKAFLIVFFVMFIGGSGVMCVIAVGMAGIFGAFGARAGGGFGAPLALAPLLFAVVPLGFVVLGIFLCQKMWKKMASVERDPVQAIPVVVVDKRTQVTGGGGNSSASTHYFVTCENEDGSRQEYQVWDGRLYGRMATDDAGILFVRAGYGLDFDRVAW